MRVTNNCFVLLIFLFSNSIFAQSNTPDQIRFVEFNKVKMEDHVWAPRTEQLLDKTLPHAFKNTEVALKSLKMCGDFLANGGKGPVPQPHRFRTSDLYKVLEGAALMLNTKRDDAIEKQVDSIIDIIAKAQRDDGYLYVAHITGSIDDRVMGKREYGYVIHSHELYNMGHLYEAAVAYARATGKTKLLEVAEKNARHVNKAFFEGDPDYNDGKPVNQAPGHQEIEIGLVKLYLYTGKRLYLDMAKRFLEIRGRTYVPNGQGVNSPIYAQQHQPVAQQREAVGHAVRACYMYAAMAEVDSLTDKDDYGKALDSIWHNIVDTKMHISGGLGAVPGIEGFGPSYVLPNKDTYLETCAAVANVLFNMRMFLKTGDAKYVDVAEIALYNNCLAGIGLDGTSFFYPNPLQASQGHNPRSGWFGTACCPSNLARLIPKISGHMYAVKGNRIYCALYGENETRIPIAHTEVMIKQSTQYPFDGDIKLLVNPEIPAEFELALRIPTWTGNQFVPGELYSYANSSDEKWQILVNGQPVDAKQENGFVRIKREWGVLNEIELRLPTPLRTNKCIDKVEDNHDRIAITRGPLLFCAEQIDNDGAVERLYFDGIPNLNEVGRGLLVNGKLANLPTVKIPAMQKKSVGVGKQEISIIPYFAWSNRDRGSMIVWLPTKPELAHIDYAAKENLKFKSVTASHTFDLDTTDAVRMKHDPKDSFDTSIRRWTSWPEKGKQQWVEITLKEGMKIKSLGVYFYDDKGGVQVPKSWYMAVRHEGEWQRVDIYNTDQYSVLKDTYNTVHPAEDLKTDKLRIYMTPQHDQTCVGILSANLETD